MATVFATVRPAMSVPTPEMEAPAGRLAGLRARYPQLASLSGSDTGKAAGLAGAMIVNNLIALVSSFVFARELSDYGSLGALIAYFLILSVFGNALQVATAREGVLGHLGVGHGLTSTLKAWTRSMAIFTVAVTVVSILLRHWIASLVGVKHDAWAAAVGLPAGCLWLELAILRGALQGVGDYRAVGLSLIGEQAMRLIVGALLAIGLGVLGAYLGTPASFLAMCVYCALCLRAYSAAAVLDAPSSDEGRPAAAHSLTTHVVRAWAPIAGLVVIAILQNIDIIAAKHQMTKDIASAYAVTVVAAKVPIWLAMGASFYLVPEASRRRDSGEDTRPVLARALGIIGVCAVPVLAIFAVAARPLLRLAFSSKHLQASSSLLILGVAFTLLACTYLAIQYMLALRRTWFLVPLGLLALAEPIILLQAPHRPASFASVVLAIQAAGCALAFAIALRHGREPAPAAVTPEPA
jgi:O-antigen/teichoic acid export membrane protein